jgi:hypothetical protein
MFHRASKGVGKDSDEKGSFGDFQLFSIAETHILSLRSPFFGINKVITETLT